MLVTGVLYRLQLHKQVVVCNILLNLTHCMNPQKGASVASLQLQPIQHLSQFNKPSFIIQRRVYTILSLLFLNLELLYGYIFSIS